MLCRFKFTSSAHAPFQGFQPSASLCTEDMVTCPYNNLHRLVWHRMAKHIFKCHREEDAKRKRESENKQNVEDQTESWDNGNYLNKNKQNAEDQEESWDNENYLTENKQNAEDQEASWTNENYLTENKQNVNDQDESWDNDDYLIENKQNSENEEECWDNESYLMY
nr:PREDICTED: major royal jelly protein 3 [Tribolium castaneum]|eukprot:XP_008196214.1 PREDICTED: major royal jelly protein 3 [Tribolium castaneum]